MEAPNQEQDRNTMQRTTPHCTITELACGTPGQAWRQVGTQLATAMDLVHIGDMGKDTASGGECRPQLWREQMPRFLLYEVCSTSLRAWICSCLDPRMICLHQRH